MEGKRRVQTPRERCEHAESGWDMDRARCDVDGTPSLGGGSAAGQHAVEPSHRHGSAAGRADLRVLVVDDHPSFRSMASRLLTGSGFSVVGEAAERRRGSTRRRGAAARPRPAGHPACPTSTASRRRHAGRSDGVRPDRGADVQPGQHRLRIEGVRRSGGRLHSEGGPQRGAVRRLLSGRPRHRSANRRAQVIGDLSPSTR